MRHDYDLLIRGGTIVDGSGKPSFVGDVAVRGDLIVAVGEVTGSAAREIDAVGLIVTPGFVDIHTHYDGQLIWSDRMAPSSDHGVTTVMTGNCGIGFAPCRPADRMKLIELMEGVEDIPEPVTSAGLTWDWESFPDFLEAVDRRRRDVDVIAMLPHSPLRVYVMGDRALRREQATAEDIARMQDLLREALDAGAMGIGTSRIPTHRSSTGEQIPSFGVDEEELLALGDVMNEKKKGVFQLVATMKPESFEDEIGFMTRFARRSGRTVTYTQAQTVKDPDYIADVRRRLAEINAAPGVDIKAQLYPRPIGLVVGLRVTANPFCMSPLWDALKDLPLEQKVAALRRPEVKAQLVGETHQDPRNPLFLMARRFESMFELGRDVPNYEPDRSESIAERAAAAGQDPAALSYELLLKDDGRNLLFVAMGNFVDYNLDFVEGMLRDENVIVGLGDGGAHYGMVCDASYPTFALTHWVRDRDHGRFSIEEMVHILARKPAETVGLFDRGLIAPGYRASINVIDHGRLTLFSPEIANDLPGGGRRLHQRADGYVATIVNGIVISENDRPTGATPGRLIRGPQAPSAANGETPLALQAAE
ncbi:N-acyl-D-amino-acid deacylase family protein [Sphingomonas bacterium]|uniref:N-acyl-D-amino-acid deacylase family protein n=1 Tax=Sphingomonas bacterium TaxID=1895847 RepID=UPI001576D794|nr:amidohydrolase family protein [Sphingomonas bacterium]